MRELRLNVQVLVGHRDRSHVLSNVRDLETSKELAVIQVIRDRCLVQQVYGGWSFSPLVMLRLLLTKENVLLVQ